jgi:hypothetical protein
MQAGPCASVQQRAGKAEEKQQQSTCQRSNQRRIRLSALVVWRAFTQFDFDNLELIESPLSTNQSALRSICTSKAEAMA